MTQNASKTFATALILLMCMMMASFAYYTDLHYPTHQTSRNLAGTNTSNPLTPHFDHKNIKEILVQNRVGSYRFIQLNNQWVMIDSQDDTIERKLPVKEEVVEQILNFTQRYNVLSEINNNDINYKAYSFDTPLYRITYTDITGDKHRFRLGVNNTLNNSHYLFHEKADKILQISPLINNFAKLTQEDIVDPSILNLSADQIVALQVRKEQGSYVYKYSDLKKVDGNWYNSKQQRIETERLASALEYLSEVKSSLVISEVNFRSINRKLRAKEPSPPILTLEVQNSAEDTYTYKIHQPERNLASLNISKNKNLIIESSLHNSLFVVNRNSLQVFDNLKEHRLKKLNIERIFY